MKARQRYNLRESIGISKVTTGAARRGMALMLVIPMVALAAVLSYALLAHVGTEARISANAELQYQADCSAESGVNYATYLLQQGLPSSISYSSNTINGNIQQSFTVSSALTAGSTSVTGTITSIGKVTRVDSQGNPVGSSIARTMIVSVQIPLADGDSSGNSLIATNGPFGNSGSSPGSAGSITQSPVSNSPVQTGQFVKLLSWSWHR